MATQVEVEVSSLLGSAANVLLGANDLFHLTCDYLVKLMNDDTARNILGIIGNVTSFLLFASPLPTVWRILKKKSVEEFKFHPYVAGIMNCVMWVLYAMPFVHPHSLLVTTVNSSGILLYVCFISIYCFYSDNKTRGTIALYLVVELLFLAALTSITIFAFHTHASRSAFVGIFCDIFGIILYSSPLTIMWKVITTKSVEFMPPALSLAGFANGVIWSAYALIKFDLYILIGNGVGAIVASVQLILYAFYYSSTPKKQPEPTNPSRLPEIPAV